MPEARLSGTLPGVPSVITVEPTQHQGGEAEIHFSTDGRWVVKAYKNAADRRPLDEMIDLFHDLRDEPGLVPPLGRLEELDGQPRVGCVTRRVPESFVALPDHLLDPRELLQRYGWGRFLKVAREVARLVAILHRQGGAHSDLSWTNVLVDFEQPAVALIDLDGLVVPGYLPPQVKGTPGFMAPELVTGTATPSEKSDRHGLAVLVLYLLLFRNVMQPQCDYDRDVAASDRLGFGERAAFSEHPTDPRHRPPQLDQPYFRQGRLSYRMLPCPLQRLTEQAFIEGLGVPHKRPQASQWATALAQALDSLWYCRTCRQHYPFPFGQPDRCCPFCGSPTEPAAAVLALYEPVDPGRYADLGRPVVLANKFEVFDDMVTPGREAPLNSKRRSLAQVSWDAGQGYQLINKGDEPWEVVGPADHVQWLDPGGSVALLAGTWIRFGQAMRTALVCDSRGGVWRS